MKGGIAVRLAKETFAGWSEDNATRLAAALAYYTAFSLAPLLIIALAVAGFILDDVAVREQVLEQVSGLAGEEAAGMIASMMEARQPGEGLGAMAIGIVVLLVGASGIFGELQSALNKIWGVKPRPKRGIKGMVRIRFLSISMVLVIGFLLLASLVLSTALAALSKFIGETLPVAAALWPLVDLVLSLAVVTVLFALIFKLLPAVKIAWRDVWFGAFVTALLFVIGKFVLGLYLGRGAVASVYGMAGSFIVVLLWVYYSAQILLLGVEFTKAHVRSRGAIIEPRKNAIPIPGRFPGEI